MKVTGVVVTAIRTAINGYRHTDGHSRARPVPGHPVPAGLTRDVIGRVALTLTPIGTKGICWGAISVMLRLGGLTCVAILRVAGRHTTGWVAVLLLLILKHCATRHFVCVDDIAIADIRADLNAGS